LVFRLYLLLFNSGRVLQPSSLLMKNRQLLHFLLIPRVYRPLALFAISAAALLQSCSKEADNVMPVPRVGIADGTEATLTISTYVNSAEAGTPVDLVPGATVDMSWYDPSQYSTSAVTQASSTLRVEFYSGATLVLVAPHELSYIGMLSLSQNSTNGVTFTIPAYLPAGDYTIHIATDVADGSLIAYTNSAAKVTDAYGQITIGQGQVTAGTGIALSGRRPAGGVYNSFPIQYPSGNTYFAYEKKVRLGLQDVDTGVFFLLAPASANWRPATSTTDNRFVTPTSASQTPYFQVSYDINDLGGNFITYPNGKPYKLYLDNYNTTYLSGSAVPLL
jgi:hypothetical protein